MDMAELPPRYRSCLDLVRAASPERPFVVAQLGQSLDGRIALDSGESRWINNAAALDHLHRLRACVDAVVVGVGTVVADDPQLNVRRVRSDCRPARVVIDPAGRMPADARLLGDDGARRIVITGKGVIPAGADRGVEHIALSSQDRALAPPAIVAALFAAGLRRLLIEGGAGTVSAFLAAAALDRLHVLVAPVLLGSGKSGLSFGPVARLADAPRPPATVHVLDDGDVLFDCDMRADRGGVCDAQA